MSSATKLADDIEGLEWRRCCEWWISLRQIWKLLATCGAESQRYGLLILLWAMNMAQHRSCQRISIKAETGWALPAGSVGQLQWNSWVETESQSCTSALYRTTGFRKQKLANTAQSVATEWIQAASDICWGTEDISLGHVYKILIQAFNALKVIALKE